MCRNIPVLSLSLILIKKTLHVKRWRLSLIMIRNPQKGVIFIYIFSIYIFPCVISLSVFVLQLSFCRGVLEWLNYSPKSQFFILVLLSQSPLIIKFLPATPTCKCKPSITVFWSIFHLGISIFGSLALSILSCIICFLGFTCWVLIFSWFSNWVFGYCWWVVYLLVNFFYF